MVKRVMWNSIGYLSISEAARANGVAVNTMWNRLNNGYTCDDDMPGACSHMKRPICWNGVQYESIAAAARANHISVSGMQNRIYNGYTCDNDLAW